MNLQPDRSYLFLAAILLVHLLFLLSSFIRTPAPISDSQEYLNAAQNLYGQGVLYSGDLSEPIIDEKFTRRPPIYPLILGIVQITNSKISIFLVQLLFSLFSICLVYKIFLLPSARLNPGRFNVTVSLGFIFLLATPAQFIYTNRIMAEVPFQLIIVLLAWSVFQHFKQREDLPASRDRYVWLFHLFLTLGMAIKPVLFPFALLAILFSMLLFMKERRRVLLLATMIPVVWITCYSVWNFNRTGSSQYSSIQTANLVNYNMRYYLAGQLGSEDAAYAVDQLYEACGNEVTYKEKVNCLNHGVRKAFLKHPVKYGVFHLKGSVRYFLDPGRFDLVTYFNIEQADTPGFLQAVSQDGIAGLFRFLKQQGWGLIILLLIIFFFKLAKISGFIIYLFNRNEQLQLRIFLVLLVGYIALVTGPLGASRFMLPVELLIIGGAIRGWSSRLKRFHLES